MKILIIAKLKSSQIKYKVQPLLNSALVDEIIVLRKYAGPKIEKLKYIILPWLFRYRLFYVPLTPLFSIYYAKKLKVDLIISYHFVPHGFNAFLTHIVTRIPYIYGQIDMDVEHYCRNGLVKLLIKKIINTSKYILVLGTRSKNFWRDLGFSEDRIQIIPSSIDTENDFYPVRKEYLYDLLFVGTLDNNKRILSIMMAVKQLVNKKHNIKLAIAGSGPLQNEVEKFIKENSLGNNIFYLGETDDIFELINSSKLFIMASEFEGLPCALMEAMACEKIVLTTPAGDIADIVKEGQTGFILNETNHISIADKIISVLKNYYDYSTISRNARDIIISDVSFKTTTLKWNNLLNEINHENLN